MRCKTLQITWHTRGTKNDPILSIDFHPTLPLLATAGADNEVKLWRLLTGDAVPAASAAGGGSGGAAGGAAAAGAVKQGAVVQFIATLEGHEMSVNAVRWAPNGKALFRAAWAGLPADWDAVNPAVLRLDYSHAHLPLALSVQARRWHLLAMVCASRNSCLLQQIAEV
jgi:WD40 repeat protein